MTISFGPFAFDRQRRLLSRDGTEIALPPRVLGVLELLIGRAGEVVARQDLLDGVWKDAFVTDTSLAEAVSFLRQALGDDPQAPRYIQTVHRRGYRFVAALTETPRGLTPDARPRGLTPDPAVLPDAGARAVSATPEVARPSILWELLPWSVAVLCASLAIAAAWRIITEPEPEAAPVARFEIQPAPGTAFDRSGPSLAVSADGRIIAWSACELASGGCALYTRGIDRLESTRLAGSDGGTTPFFSPDGRWIGFFADGKLKKIAASGGAASVLANAPAPAGASWSADGTIAFAGTIAGGIAIVSDEGGMPASLTTPRANRGEVRHAYPAWLSGGALIFTIASTTTPDVPGELAALPPRGRDWKALRAGVARAAQAAPGYLLLSTGNDLQAVTFDERTLTLTGRSDSIGASVAGGPVADFATAGGALVAVGAPPPLSLRWSDGKDAAPLARLSSIAISPDGTRAAGVIADAAGSDLWIADLASNALTRVTYGGVNLSPAWSADGARLFFAARPGTSGPFGVATRRIDDRAITMLPVATSAHVLPSSAAADGRLAATLAAPDGRTAVAIVAGEGGAAEPLQAVPFDESSPAFSRDGRWLAFQSSESGRPEVIIRDMRNGQRRVVSTDGGTHPRWGTDGRAIYFDAGRRVLRARFDPDAGATTPPEVVYDGSAGIPVAITPAGRVLVAARPATPDRGFIILQWLRELRQRLPIPVTAPR